MPTLMENAPCKESREGTGSQILGYPCGLTNLSRGQPLPMLAEQGDNDATAVLNLGDDSPAVGRRDGCGLLLPPLHHHALGKPEHNARQRREACLGI
jgi:hypothetical protein